MPRYPYECRYVDKADKLPPLMRRGLRCLCSGTGLRCTCSVPMVSGTSALCSFCFTCLTCRLSRCGHQCGCRGCWRSWCGWRPSARAGRCIGLTGWCFLPATAKPQGTMMVAGLRASVMTSCMQPGHFFGFRNPPLPQMNEPLPISAEEGFPTRRPCTLEDAMQQKVRHVWRSYSGEVVYAKLEPIPTLPKRRRHVAAPKVQDRKN